MDVEREVALSGQPSSAAATSVFEEWVRPTWSAMCGLARRIAPTQSDDVLQEALLEAWKHRARYDPARGSARSWLLAITAHQAYKRHRGRVVSTLLPSSAEAAQSRDASAESVDLQRAISSLPRRQRLAVELYYFAGLPVDEVAEAMGCRSGTVKATLSAARANLRGYLGREYRNE